MSIFSKLTRCVPGHSLTIIGFEKLKNGAKQLIVFDPSFHDSSYIVRLIGQASFTHPMPDLALKPYRRGNRYLKAYKEFELLRWVLPKLCTPDTRRLLTMALRVVCTRLTAPEVR